MAHELSFWRYEPGDRPEARSVYLALGKREPIAGLAPFPVTGFLTQLAERWSHHEIEVDAPDYRVYRISPSAVVEITCSEQHADVTLRPIDRDLANDVIESASSVDAPLYDPQVNERFDSYTTS